MNEIWVWNKKGSARGAEHLNRKVFQQFQVNLPEDSSFLQQSE